MLSKTIVYDDKSVRQFTFASVIWGIVGMLVGVIVASQLAFPSLNLPPILNYGRLRPLHTNAVIFAFVGNMLFAGIYYSSQRLLKTRMASDVLSRIHFWGWQLIIVMAALTLPLGITQGKEYAELEWFIDISIAVVWVVFAINFFWTLKKRNERQLYVALWFYIATIVTVAVLHIVNNISLPLSLFKSYSIYAGAQDALVQWWYGHNAVAFFLTTPILGIMYYFMPKAIDRPVYSYRLSIVHFWALVFMYIWAGPHHLLYTSLPDWAQTLGMIFSVALWAPSWGGMINGLLTLRGAWDKLRTDPVIKFFAAAVTFYGMSTFEGPMLSIKSVNALAHSTDWIIAHVHGGALGWNGFMAAGMFYWLVPKLYGVKLRSEKMANLHFWVGTFGILLYMVSMYASGLTQGLMWRGLTDQGTLLYPNFLESIFASHLMYIIRILGGALYLGSFIVMAWNLFATAKDGKPVESSVTVVVEDKPAQSVSGARLIFSPVMLVLIIGLVLMLAMGPASPIQTFFILIGFAVLVVASYYIANHKMGNINGSPWHQLVEHRPLLFTVLVLLSILVGGIVELVPMLASATRVVAPASAKPYTPLELVGRDIYVREGCYTCHTQMIRPLVAESLRYGKPSELWESMYDHPFQWGSKRTGPDLARVGGKYPDLWHFKHMIDPRSTSPGSIMPPYSFLLNSKVNWSVVSKEMALMTKLGVPYSPEEIQGAVENAKAQAQGIVTNLNDSQSGVNSDSQLVALISYLQRLGKDMKGANP